MEVRLRPPYKIRVLFTQENNMNYEEWVGKKVIKTSGKPFKSKSKINTVSALMIHTILFEKTGEIIPCFTFEEDDSYVDCRSCELVSE